jgi:DNA-binding response OmpR family regulator
MRSNGISRRSKSRSTPTVVAVSGDRLRERLLDALTLDEDGFDVIVVESIAHGYSRIKQLTPDLIVVLLEIDDVDACQLLAMLTLDRNVSRIPVVTCVASRGGGHRAGALWI